MRTNTLQVFWETLDKNSALTFEENSRQRAKTKG